MKNEKPTKRGFVASIMPTRDGRQMLRIAVGRSSYGCTVPADFEARQGMQLSVREAGAGTVEIVT